MIEKLHKLHFWCQKVLPLVYDDSLSYYELLCKVVKYLNIHTEQINLINELLQNFSPEVERVIREMAEDGELDPIIANALSGIVANPYDDTGTKTYYPDDVVIHDGLPYKCIEETSGEWDASKWEQLPIGDMISNLYNILAEPYDETKTYYPDDIVMHNGEPYVCIAQTTGDWDASKWELTTFGDSITNIYNDFYEGIYINVKRRGAVGDGLTDDTVAIQNTINEAVQKNKRVFIPEGIFIITQPLVIPTTQTYYQNELWIEGMGKCSIIRKANNAQYDSVNAAIYSNNSDLKKIINLAIENTGTDGWCIYSKNDAEVNLNSLWLSGQRGIYLNSWLCLTELIDFRTTEKAYVDSGTGNVVNNVFAYNCQNPYTLGGAGGSYNSLNADICTGDIITVTAFTGVSIGSSNIESPNADHIVKCNNIYDVGNVHIGTLSAMGLANGKSIISVTNGIVSIDNLILFNTVLNENVNYLVDFNSSNNGSVKIRNVSLDKFSSANLKWGKNRTPRNALMVGTGHTESFVNADDTNFRFSALGRAPAYDSNVQSLPATINLTPAIWLGCYIDGDGKYMHPKGHDNSSLRYMSGPPSGSLIINDITGTNAKGIAGFITTDGSFDDITIATKVPIPIFIVCAPSELPSYATKEGIIWFDTSANKLKIRGTTGWYAIDTTLIPDT